MGEGHPELRASDADRDRVAALLRDGRGEGRLTLEEFSDRLDAAYAARTAAELQALTRDLPVGPAAEAAPARPTRRPTRWSVAVMSGCQRKGRWRVEGRTVAVAVMGGVELDLRSAEIAGPEVEISAVSIMGGIQITVPEGVQVEVTGLAVMGGKSDRVKDVPPRPGAPLVRVRVFALMGGVDIRSKPGSTPARSLPSPAA